MSSVIINGRDSTSNNPQEIKSTNGAAQVVQGFTGQARIREEAALAGSGARAAVTFTWPSPGIKSVTIGAFSEAAGTAELPAAIAICFDPPNTATRDAWLIVGDSISSDSQREIVKADAPPETFYFSSPITTLGVINAWGTQVLTVIASGTEVS